MARAVSQKVQGPGELIQIDRPGAAKHGSVVVRITARPVQIYDLLSVNTSRIFPDGEFIPGIEGVGIVEEVGEGVSAVKKGDRVAPLLMWDYYLGKRQGSWQDFVIVSEKDAVKVPDDVSDEDAAQMITNPFTAYALIKELNASKGRYILQNGAGSVVGRTIIQLAKHWGIKTINLVRRDDAKEELKNIGADEVINVSTEDVISKVKELTSGAGVEGAIDMVSGLQTKLAASCVKSGGKVLTIGTLESTDIVISAHDLLRKVSHRFWSLTHISSEEQQFLGREVVQLLKAKVIGPFPVVAKFPLEDFKAAVKHTEEKPGKVLLVG